MSVCVVCEQPLIEVTTGSIHPTCEVDPQVVAAEVFTILREGILNQPRGKQRMIGPSEIGQPCARRIGYRIAQVPRTQREDVAWKPFVGTSLHEMVGNIIARHEIARFSNDQGDTKPRWHVEERVTVGTVNGVEITGSCDLFDQETGTVFDWKFVGDRKLNQYKAEGPGQQYTWQAHLYGQGWVKAGYEVRNVAIIFMTRDGNFDDRIVWSEPFDPEIAAIALERLASIDTLIDELGAADALSVLDTASNYCQYCPWFRKNSDNVATGCPGHKAP